MPSHQEITTTGFDHGGKTFEFARVDARPGSQREIHAILSNSALELWEKEQELRGNFEADDIAATVVDSLLGEIDEESLRALEGLIVEKRRDLSIPALRGILHRYRHPSLDFPFLNAVVHAEFRPITAQLAKTSADPVVFVEEAVGVLRELGLRGLFNHGLCSEISDLLRSRREALSPEVFIEYLRGLGLGHTKDIAEFGALLDEAGSIHAMSPRFVTMLMMGWGEIPIERPHLAIEVADHLEDMWDTYQPVEKVLTLQGLARVMEREDFKSLWADLREKIGELYVSERRGCVSLQNIIGAYSLDGLSSRQAERCLESSYRTRSYSSPEEVTALSALTDRLGGRHRRFQRFDGAIAEMTLEYWGSPVALVIDHPEYHHLGGDPAEPLALSEVFRDRILTENDFVVVRVPVGMLYTEDAAGKLREMIRVAV